VKMNAPDMHSVASVMPCTLQTHKDSKADMGSSFMIDEVPTAKSAAKYLDDEVEPQ
jgi:hypothetical protein